MSRQEWLKKAYGMMHLAITGQLDDLPCPDCQQNGVTVRFTQPQKGVYRVWYLCMKCKFRLRTQVDARPRHYSEERVNERLQAYDADILAKRHFKIPPEHIRD